MSRQPQAYGLRGFRPCITHAHEDGRRAHSATNRCGGPSGVWQTMPTASCHLLRLCNVLYILSAQHPATYYHFAGIGGRKAHPFRAHEFITSDQQLAGAHAPPIVGLPSLYPSETSNTKPVIWRVAADFVCKDNMCATRWSSEDTPRRVPHLPMDLVLDLFQNSSVRCIGICIIDACVPEGSNTSRSTGSHKALPSMWTFAQQSTQCKHTNMYQLKSVTDG